MAKLVSTLDSEELRNLNREVFQSLCAKLTDRRFTNEFIISGREDRKQDDINYSMQLKHRHEKPAGVIAGYNLRIYFNYNIDISFSVCTVENRFAKIKYYLFNGLSASAVCIESEEYVSTMYEFLFGLARWGSSLAYAPSSYQDIVPSCYEKEDFPFKYLSRESAHEDMFLHRYSWNNKDELKYMIDVWNSEEYKGSRAGFDSWAE